jgi:hypothetical protein
MPEEQDKEINYKILTAEEILKEAQVPAKVIEHREEKIEVPVTETIDKKVETSPAEKIEESVEVIETEKKEAGVLYPEFKEKPIELESIGIQSGVEFGNAIEIKGPQPTIIQPIEKKEESKPEIQEKAPEEPKEEIFYFKPEEKLKPIQETKEPQIIERKEKPKIKFNLNYVLIPGALIIILFLIFFLKPYEKIKALLQPKEKQPPEEIVPTTTPTQIIFPTTSPTQETTTSITFTTITVPTLTQEIKQVATETSSISQEKKPETLPTKELNLPGKMVTLQRKDFESFLARQEFFGTKINVKLLENNQKIPIDFLFDYFIKVKNSQELKDELTGNYGFVIYYGYVRKYPILVFEIKDRNKVIKFNQNWEKTTIKKDLQTLFLGFQPPRTTNNFQTKSFNNFSYRILNFDDNYKIVWATTNNYLIYTTTETGLKEVFRYLQ